MNKETMIKITEPEIVSKIEPIEYGATGVIIYNYDKSHIYYKGIDLGSFEELLNVKKYITDLQQEIERLNNIITKAIEAINVYQNEKTLSVGYQDLKRIRGILRGNEFDLQMFEEYLKELGEKNENN